MWDLEARIPARHPLPKMRQVVNAAPDSLDDAFVALYTDFRRPSIAPERLIWASLLQFLFLIRSGRQLMEQMDYNPLFRWFVGLGIDAPVWGEDTRKSVRWTDSRPERTKPLGRRPTVFNKNRDRLLSTEMSREVMPTILAHRGGAPLLPDDHFSLVKDEPPKAPPAQTRWRTALMKSFRPKAGAGPSDDDSGEKNGPKSRTAPPFEPIMPETTPMIRENRTAVVNFRGQRRSNATHVSTNDPDARLYKKSHGTGAVLCFVSHALMDMRHGPPSVQGPCRLRSGLIVQSDLMQAKAAGGMAQTLCRGVERGACALHPDNGSEQSRQLPKTAGRLSVAGRSGMP